MSEFQVRVIRVGELQNHPDADRLWVTKVYGYPVITGKGDLATGDLAVYVPVDSVVPDSDPRWEFLGGHTRIRAKKLRGIFSMGLLTRADPGMEEGQDVAEIMGITKYEPVISNPEQDEADPGIATVYDVEGYRRWSEELTPIFLPDEPVVVTEKLHGENARFSFYGGRMYCGSHTRWKKDTATSQWWGAARTYNLEKILSTLPTENPLVFYGEILGHVPDMHYGHINQIRGLAFFDILDVNTRTFLDWQNFQRVMAATGLPSVPVLYEGPFSQMPAGLENGPTTYPRASGKHIREGIVMKTQVERQDQRIGRVSLKLHGQAYLLRSKG